MKVESPIAPILMGTTAVQFMGDPYYGKLALSCSAACVPLPRAGMMHIPDAADQLAPILEQFRQPDGKLKLITHSQGALIGMLHADKHPNTEVLAFGGPFRGAPSAKLMCLFPKRVRRAVPALRDMSPKSYFMKSFAEVLKRNAACLTSVATTHDRIVPHHSSYVVGARNVLIVSRSGEEVKHRASDLNLGIEVMVVPHVGHIAAVMNQQCRDFARDFIHGSALHLATA